MNSKGSLRATSALKAGSIAARTIVDTITLDRQSRYRRRVLLRTDNGRDILLDLPEAIYLADGDALTVDGGVVIVKAAAEDLLEIHAHDSLALATIAWHLGNRHTPAEITRDAIYIQPDHVLADLVTQLGAHVHKVRRPFEPEGGAYGGKGPLQAGHSHGHHGHHSHDHSHHGHSQSHEVAGDIGHGESKVSLVRRTFPVGGNGT